MKAQGKIFDDLARVAGGAVNIVSGMQQQIREDIKVRVEEMATRMDLVPREDLDQALAMIKDLQKRVDELEAVQGSKKPVKKKKTAPKAVKDKKKK